MSDFKIIPQAPAYKINKQGEVQRLDGTKPMLISGKAILKNSDGVMEQFSVEDLVNQLFGDDKEVPQVIEPNVPLEFTSTIKPSNGIQTEEQVAEENNTNESEDQELIKESAKTVDQPRSRGANETKVKKGRGRPTGSKNKKGTKEKVVKEKKKRGRPTGSKNKKGKKAK